MLGLPAFLFYGELSGQGHIHICNEESKIQVIFHKSLVQAMNKLMTKSGEW
jgi:hypothetical protein